MTVRAEVSQTIVASGASMNLDGATSRFIEAPLATIVCDTSARTVIVISHSMNRFEHSVSTIPVELSLLVVHTALSYTRTIRVAIADYNGKLDLRISAC